MKKIIFTTTIVLAASLTFYIHEGASLLNTAAVLSQNAVNYESFMDPALKDTKKLDIVQADIK